MSFLNIALQGTNHILVDDSAGQMVYPIGAIWYTSGYQQVGGSAPSNKAAAVLNVNEVTLAIQVGSFNKTIRMRPLIDSISVAGTPQASVSALLTALAAIFN